MNTYMGFFFEELLSGDYRIIQTGLLMIDIISGKEQYGYWFGKRKSAPEGVSLTT